MVSQFIRVKNPPGRRYVAFATMPFPTGTDVSTLSNDVGGLQQYRLIGQKRAWDLYEWMVMAPPGTTLINIGDSFPQPVPPGGKPVGSGQLGEPAPGPKDPLTPGFPIDPMIARTLALLARANTFMLRFTAENTADQGTYEEFVSLSSGLDTTIRSGFLRFTLMKHVRTQKFGSLHVFWDVTANDPYIRLTINWHAGIPAPEVLCHGIQLMLPDGMSWVPELNDCACDPSPLFLQQGLTPVSLGGGVVQPSAGLNTFLLLPSPTNHLMPRMGQRAFRVLIFSTSVGAPAPLQTQYAGWGMADWSDGGFMPGDLKLHSLSYAANLEANVVADATRENANLRINSNNWEGAQQPSSQQPLWPAYGQMYGGPTGSDSKYKAYNGVKTAAANRREGLLYHKVLQLRNHSRHWFAIYEEEGTPVVPDQHLDSNGAAQWRAYVGNGSVFEEDDPFTNFLDPYGLWKDEGFNFDQFRQRRTPRKPPELQTSGGGVLGNAQRWDCWDMQHQMLTWQDDLALCYLEADPLSIMYITEMAETQRLVYWTGTGAARRLTIPVSTGIGVEWGRDVHWSVYCVAAAAVFQTEQSAAYDDDNGELLPTTRRTRWRDSILAVYMQGTDKAMMPNGCAWIGGGSGKVFTDPPFSSGYYINQVFEICYGMNAILACYGVFGNHWMSVRNPGQQVDVLGLIEQFARCMDLMHWGTSTALTGVTIAPGYAGSGYQANDVVFLVGDHYALTGGTPVAPAAESQVRINTVGGGGEAATVSVNNGGTVFTQPGAPTRTYARVDTPVLVTPGTGYKVGDVLTPVGGTPIAGGQNWRARFRVSSISGGGATGPIATLALDQIGRYLVPPAPPGALVYLPGTSGAGAGATASWARSASGSGMRVNTTWGGLVEASSLPWKIVPFGPYPGSTRYTTRADFVPLDIPNRTTLKGEVALNPFGTQHAIVSVGSGYQVNDVVSLVGGSRNHAAVVPATFRITQVDGLGQVTGIQALTPGSYTVVPDNPTPVSGGAGAGLTINVVYAIGAGQQTLVGASVTATIGLFGLAGAAEAVALLLQFTNTASVAAAIQTIKNRGLPSGPSGQEQIENYYPILPAFDPPA